MGLFFSKPFVSTLEFKQARAELYSRGFTQQELDRMEELFMGYMNNPNQAEHGITGEELESVIKWLRENMSKHHFSTHHIDMMEEALKKRL